MKMRGCCRPYSLVKRYLNPGDICYSFDRSTGEILKLKVLEVIDFTHRCRSATWRTGAVYYFVEGIPNESALGEEIYLNKREAQLAFKNNVCREIKDRLKWGP